MRVEEDPTEAEAVWVTLVEAEGRPGIQRRLVASGLAREGPNPPMFDWGNDGRGGRYCDITRQSRTYHRRQLWSDVKPGNQSGATTIYAEAEGTDDDRTVVESEWDEGNEEAEGDQRAEENRTMVDEGWAERKEWEEEKEEEEEEEEEDEEEEDVGEESDGEEDEGVDSENGSRVDGGGGVFVE